MDHVASALGTRHEVKSVDLAPEDGASALDAALADFRPAVVGISIRNVDNTEAESTLSFAKEAAAWVRRIRSACGAKIVLGGAGFSLFPDAMLAAAGGDYGIRGEGEWALGLVDAIAEGRDPFGLPGVVVAGRAAPPPAIWPGPYARALPSMQAARYYLERGGMLNVQTKRGCPYACSYCTYPLIEGNRLRLFDPETVADQWEGLVRAGARFVFVTDAVFNAHEQHNLDVAAALVRRGVKVPWGAFFSPTQPRPGYYEALRAAGLTHVELGTESLHDGMLQSYRKPFTARDAIAAHRAARAAGAHVAHYLMLGGPGETLDTARATLDACERLDDAAALFFFCGVRVYPGTELSRMAIAEGQIEPGDPLLEPRFYCSPAATPEQLTVLVRSRARPNWIVGSGDAAMAALMQRMYARGATGPLWERLRPA
jgi:radical SAM superfamily enzyme YgiQ (UPF0313 family)